MNLSSSKIKKRAFSLIEISVILLIIGVIVAGISKSSTLYNKYRIATARNLTQASPVNSIPDLALWYETTMEESFNLHEAQNYNDTTAAEKALGIGLIQTWNDNNQDGGVRINSIQTTLAKRPEYHLDCINNLPCLRFNGTSHHLTIPATFSPDNKEYSIFIVDKKDSTGTFPYLFFGPAVATTAENDAIAIGYDSSSKGLYSHGSSSAYYNMNLSKIDSNDRVTLHSFIGAFDNNLLTTFVSHRLYDSIASTSLSSVGSPAFLKVTNGEQYFIGAGRAESTLTHYKGDIGEIIIFERALKANERKSVEQYLMDKWKTISDTNPN